MFSFPPTDEALTYPNGLLAAGGDLEPQTLLSAYRIGVFPWFEAGQPILWWTPDPRTVLLPGEFHCARSLKRSMRRCTWQVACDRDFAAVIEACAEPRGEDGGTWIVDDMKRAYLALHRLGFAHSIELYDGSDLVGGLYGVRLGSVFFGESMFCRQTDASKMALAALVWLGSQERLSLIDCQMESSHLASLGAKSISRSEFENHLAIAITYGDLEMPAGPAPSSLDHLLGRPLPRNIKELV